MSTTTKEKIAASLKAELAAQQGQWTALANKAFDESQKLLELQTRAARESIEKLSARSSHLLAAKSPQDLFSVDTNGIQDELNRMMYYGGELSRIASNLQIEVNQLLQAQLSKGYGTAIKLVEESLHPGADDSRNPLDWMKNGFEQWADVARKTVESVGENFKDAPPSGKKSRQGSQRTGNGA
ncbi:phasin family protein [Oxalobacteraceae bacterium GrIS 2.11]